MLRRRSFGRVRWTRLSAGSFLLALALAVCLDGGPFESGRSFADGNDGSRALRAQPEITGPPGSEAFGYLIRVLPNGNFVVTDPYYDAPGPLQDVGAVYLYDGDTLGQISALTGSTASDFVGFNVTVLPNGNFVVVTQSWDKPSPATSNVGAVTFCSAVSGCNGPVSPANSLVGSQAADGVGDIVMVLENGNYVVLNPWWDNGAVPDGGAVTFCSAITGCMGEVSAVNSLVGSTLNDRMGIRPVMPLPNGNYLVRNEFWDNVGLVDAGALSFCSGTNGCVGAVSAANSLIGGSAGDNISAPVSGGGSTLVVRPNSDYIVVSHLWDNTPAATDAGAVTFCSGTTGCAGPITAGNSLVGSTTGDHVGVRVNYSGGWSGVQFLSDGDYIVASDSWTNAGTANAGAVTFCNGATGCQGTVSPANSLVGTTMFDSVGIGGVTEVGQGKYVVASAGWRNGGLAGAGAVTLCDGTTGCTGPVTAGNSLVGSSEGDGVGFVAKLANGNYLVNSSTWSNTDPDIDEGAVTFCALPAGCTGPVTPANSLVGSTHGDHYATSILALPNGNYVAAAFLWSDGATYAVGAATFCNGTAGCTGPRNAGNSLIGTTAGDNVGRRVTALPNGNYVVSSRGWENGAFSDAGAVTVCNGTTGCTGAVSAANSLVGTHFNDQVGELDPTILPNGDFLVTIPRWSAATGAVVYCSAVTGCPATISSATALVGMASGDFAGYGALNSFDPQNGVTVLTNGNYIVRSLRWQGNRGAVTFCPASGCTGVVDASNSLVGSVANDYVGVYGPLLDPDGSYILVSAGYHVGATGFRGAATFGDGENGTVGPITSSNSLLGNDADGFSLVAYDPDKNRILAGGGTVIVFDGPSTSISDPCPGPANISLVAGATGAVYCGNGFPLTATPLRAPGALPDSVSAVFSWDNAGQLFDFWFRGFPDAFQTLTSIAPGNFYFFQSPGGGLIPNTGGGTTLAAAGADDIETVAGANGAVWSGTDHATGDLSTFANIAQVSAIFQWNNAGQLFDFWFRGFPDNFQTLSPGIQRGGYFFFQAPGGQTILMD